MSVIVALKDEDRIIVGCDSRMSTKDICVDNYQRCQKARHICNCKDVIVGAVGEVALVDVFEKALKDVDSIDRNVLFNDVIPKVRNAIRGTPMEDNDGGIDGSVIVAYKDKAYEITGNYIVLDINSYCAIGSGMPIAYGSLYTSENMNITPEARVMLAIEATGTYNVYVSKEAYISDTKSEKFMRFISTKNSKK